MLELWIPLNDLPADGQEFQLTDQSLWTVPMQEFGVPGRLGKAFEATLFLTPQDGGCLVTGSFSGSVIQPCGRCLEEFELPVAGEFDSFEAPCAPEAGEQDVCRMRRVGGAWELDAAGIIWEQFVLALPDKPLCDESCKGLCPACGVNRNQEDCACVREEGDSRLAVLRNLKLS